jgi:hypothetical protein
LDSWKLAFCRLVVRQRAPIYAASHEKISALPCLGSIRTPNRSPRKTPLVKPSERDIRHHPASHSLTQYILGTNLKGWSGSR